MFVCFQEFGVCSGSFSVMFGFCLFFFAFGLLVFLEHRWFPRLAFLSSFVLLQIRHGCSFVDESVFRDPRHRPRV